MARERVLIIGGGITGLAAAGFLAEKYDCTLVERESELGGYCRTIYQDGFTWDYSGHFFHFRNSWIADYVHGRMNVDRLLNVDRISHIYFRDRYIDYPFQFNIHQLSQPDFIQCLRDMYAAQQSNQSSGSFHEMVYSRYGKRMSDLFFLPYNEKLYSLPASQLDVNAMGRFFPHIDFGTLLDHIAQAGHNDTKQAGYNASFCYHQDGAKAYVDALASYIPDGVIRLNSSCQKIDVDHKVAIISGEPVDYDRLIISAPLPTIMNLVGWETKQNILTANKVVTFNLGFDLPSLRPDHWVYYPEPEWIFFRVGHYDNILSQSRMSLYVEVALPEKTEFDASDMLSKILQDLKSVGVVDQHELISWKSVLLNPAYVHITTDGQVYAAECIQRLEKADIIPLGRYGQWKYCSIEDNILDAYELAQSWGAAPAGK